MNDIEKAIEVFKKTIMGARMSLMNQEITDNGLTFLKAFTTATRALEKQVPKKVLPHDEHNTGIRVCPNCKSIKDWRVKYCSNCGQKLLWE